MPITFTALAAMTLDGKIAKNSRQSSFDWTSPEDKKFFLKELANYEAVLVGRNTFEIAKLKLTKRNTVVLTSRVKTVTKKYDHVWFVNYKKVNLNKFLSELGYKKIAVLGGSKVYAWCLQKNLLNELWLTLEPLAFGKGISLFGKKNLGIKKFELVSIKKLNKQGSLVLRYIKK